MPCGSFFDAHIAAGQKFLLAVTGTDECLPDPFPSGGIVRGAGDAFPDDARWLRAASLNQLLGPRDARYPARARVIDLEFADSDWHEQLRRPAAEWFPLCGAARGPVVHLNARDFPKLARGLVQLARRFPHARFLVDPFLSASPGEEQWRAGVCVADQPNVWATTRGLFGPQAPWKRGFHQEALHFIVGEIGAGKALFASGLSAMEWSRGTELQLPHPEEWLRSCAFLDEAQIRLMLRENARALFE